MIITAIKGETTMSDQEKFEGLKKSLIDENERKYGAEIREKFGDTAVDESNAKLKSLTQSIFSVHRNRLFIFILVSARPCHAPRERPGTVWFFLRSAFFLRVWQAWNPSALLGVCAALIG